MWLFTEHGAFSVVAVREDSGAPSRTRMWVRARERAHLEHLIDVMSWHSKRIQEWAGADYQWRLTISRAEWYRLARTLAEGVTYHNFKNHIAVREDGSRYERMLHHVWSLVRAWLDERPEPTTETCTVGLHVWAEHDADLHPHSTVRCVCGDVRWCERDAEAEEAALRLPYGGPR